MCGQVAVRRIQTRAAVLLKRRPIQTLARNDLVEFPCGGILFRDIIKIIGEK
jgi:hypothetical protein